MNAQELKTKLLSQLEPTLSHLFPAGKTKGRQFLIGDITGGSGKTLQVELSGPKAGLWIDRADPAQCGDILSLWMAARSLTFVDALDDIRRYLGITQLERVIPPKPHGFGPNHAAQLLGTEAYLYLTNRGIQPETMKAYRLRRHPTEEAIAFRHWTPDGEDAFVKYCSIFRGPDGKKQIWSTKPYATLWGWWMVTPNDRSLIITEGEIDAMTLYQMLPGIPVLSMHSGASNLNWLDNDFHRLDQFETIYVVSDMDDAGDKCAAEIAKRIGLTRVARVSVPGGYKDPNEVWKSGDESLLDWSSWVSQATYFIPSTLRTPSSFLQEAQRILAKKKEDRAKNDFLFPEMPFSYRDGETTIVSGEPGHGKSDFLYQTHIQEMINGRRVMICSMEIIPAQMLVLIAQQCVGHYPSTAELGRVCEWLQDRLIYHTGKSAKGADHELGNAELFADMQYAYKRYGINRYIIDSLHFLVDKEEYQEQDQFTRQLQQFNQVNGTHTALVAHSNIKGRRDGFIPGRHDVEGSGGMIKPIDNGLTIWRNEAKQEKLEEEDTEANRNLHDGLIKVWKQRDTGDHFTRKLWFDKESRTFRTKLAFDGTRLLESLRDEPSPVAKEEMF